MAWATEPPLSILPRPGWFIPDFITPGSYDGGSAASTGSSLDGGSATTTGTLVDGGSS